MSNLKIYIISVSFQKQDKLMRGIIEMDTDKYTPGTAVHHVVSEFQHDAESWVLSTYARQNHGWDYRDVLINKVEKRNLDAIIRIECNLKEMF